MKTLRIRGIAAVCVAALALAAAPLASAATPTAAGSSAEKLAVVETPVDETASSDELPAWTQGIACTVCHANLDYTADEADDEVEVDGEDGKAAAPETAAPAKVQVAADAADDAEGDDTDDEEDAVAACLIEKHTLLTCVDCHPDNDDMDWAHWGVTEDSETPEALKYSSVDSAVCLSCHADDYTPEATEGVEITDTTGLGVNPHDLPDADDTHSSVTCTDCHTMHEAKDAAEAAFERCSSCHHQKVWGCACHND